jgi:hypothetical protein
MVLFRVALPYFEHGQMSAVKYGILNVDTMGDRDKAKLRSLHFSTNVITMTKPMRMRWTGHAARMVRSGMHMRFWWESQKERDH